MDWVVTLEFDQLIDADRCDELLEQLRPQAASIEQAPDHTGIILSVDGLEGDAEAALRCARGYAAGIPGRLVGAQVQTAAALERELQQPQVPELGGVTEFAELLGLSRQRAWGISQKPDFPAPIMELAAGPVWLRSQLEHWANTHERKPGRPPKVAVEA
jgi:predicted DNA-binding transcriptional regulator AlpA